MFSLSFPIHVYILAAASVASAILFALLTFGKLRRVMRRSITDGKLSMPKDAEFPSVSIIVHDDAQAWNLIELLPRLLEQDYPAETEVIVVNDGSKSAAEDVIARLEGRYSNLYMTFLPEHSRNLSRRKLAIMLGVKAARYDMVAIIGGNCMVDSPMWLRAMMRHATRGKQLIIGWAYPTLTPDATDPRISGSRCRSFDIIRTGVQYLSWAAARHPWRANGYNLAFSRELFYKNRGFASSLNLIRGDDDMWIKEVATKDSCAVELSPESMIAVMDNDQVTAHRIDKLTHEFTSRKPGRGARFTSAIASWAWWGWIACSIACILTGLPSLIPLIFITIVSLSLCLPYMVRWRRVSARLHGRRLFLLVPWFTTWHPMYALLYKIRAIGRRRQNYTAGRL